MLKDFAAKLAEFDHTSKKLFIFYHKVAQYLLFHQKKIKNINHFAICFCSFAQIFEIKNRNMDDKKIIFSMVGVNKIFPPHKQVLKDIYLSFFYGAKIGIIGLNGSG